MLWEPFMTKAHNSRRRFLMGLGAAVALPAFESLRPSVRAFADGASLATTATGAPLRMAFCYVPNGAHQLNWWPTGAASEFQLAKTMVPLAAVKNQIQVLGGVDHKEAYPGPDGAGD